MNVLFLATDAFGAKGGIAQSNRDLLDALSNIEEVKCINLVTRSGSSIEGGGLDKVKAHNKHKTSAIGFIWSAVKLAKDGCDIVICGHINYLYLAVFLKISTNSKLILMAHGIEVWRGNKKKALLASWIDSVWHVSFFTKQQMSKWLMVPENAYMWLPNLIDLEKYKKRPKNKGIQKKYGLVDKKVILTISRLSSAERYKGHDELISVMPRLISIYPNIRYLIVGDGDDKARLENKVDQLGIKDYVIFSGYVSEEEKIDIYAISNAFVMVGSGEGFGLVYLESLACGTPVVGSVRDASKEVLLDGRLGELADPADPDSIFHAVIKTLNNSTRNYSELAEFSRPKYFARVSAAYKSLI